MNYVYGIERKCPGCGKRFIPTLEWVYKRRGLYFCSWGCFRRDEDKKPTQKPAKKIVTRAQKEEAARMILQGTSCAEIARKMGVTVYAVSKIRKEIKEADL